jgi:hypothetical protein
VTSRQQPACQVRADEPGAAGHEGVLNVHEGCAMPMPGQ